MQKPYDNKYVILYIAIINEIDILKKKSYKTLYVIKKICLFTNWSKMNIFQID